MIEAGRRRAAGAVGAALPIGAALDPGDGDAALVDASDGAVGTALAQRDDAALVDYHALPGARMSVPTPDHYLPLLYAAAAAEPDAPVITTYEGLEMGSLSMRCVRFG